MVVLGTRVQDHPLLILGIEGLKLNLQAAGQHSLVSLELAVVRRKVAHRLELAVALLVLKHHNLADELQRQEDLDFKVLAEGRAGKLGLGDRHGLQNSRGAVCRAFYFPLLFT